MFGRKETSLQREEKLAKKWTHRAEFLFAISIALGAPEAVFDFATSIVFGPEVLLPEFSLEIIPPFLALLATGKAIEHHRNVGLLRRGQPLPPKPSKRR